MKFAWLVELFVLVVFTTALLNNPENYIILFFRNEGVNLSCYQTLQLIQNLEETSDILRSYLTELDIDYEKVYKNIILINAVVSATPSQPNYLYRNRRCGMTFYETAIQNV